MTVEPESEKSQNYRDMDHAEKATPIFDRGKKKKNHKISYICIIIIIPGVFKDGKSIPRVIVTLKCICDDLGSHLGPHPYATAGKIPKIKKIYMGHD